MTAGRFQAASIDWADGKHVENRQKLDRLG